MAISSSNSNEKNKLSRNPPSKEPAKTVLIVCEGQKTEVNYFKEFTRFHRLNSVVIVDDRKGRSPSIVVEEAIKQNHVRKTDDGEGFDHVACVFDRDKHDDFEQAVQQAKSQKFHCYISDPCFEFWILLHFEYTRAPFLETKKDSVGDLCIKKLKKHLPKYAKNQKGLYEKLLNHLETACKNAERTCNEAAKDKERNPSTNIHCLVRLLQKP